MLERIEKKESSAAVPEKGACAETFFDPDRIAIARDALPDDRSVVSVSEFFRILGDATRLKIVMALFENELCVCDLAGLTGVTVSAVSHQLRVLRAVRLVRYRRQGKMAYYSLDDQHIASIIAQAREHLDAEQRD